VVMALQRYLDKGLTRYDRADFENLDYDISFQIPL
jgi:hypothetical protein